jgi:hypothetical protein
MNASRAISKMRLLELFAGTGSVGTVFRERGWEVLSVDINPKSSPDLCMDVMDFEYWSFTPDHFQCIHASPPCTHYSRARTTAKTPRDLDGSDELVQRVLDITSYFGDAAWWMENPHSGLLKTREVVQGLPYHVLDYCRYGTLYRKRTCLWSNVFNVNFLTCDRQCTGWCGTTHAKTAQRGPGRRQIEQGIDDRCPLDELYALPRALVEVMEDATRRFLR